MWISHWLSGLSSESIHARVLLADDSERCPRHSSILPRIPIQLKGAANANKGLASNTSGLAFGSMGNRHRQTTPESSGKPGLRNHRCGVFHQVGRSRARGEHYYSKHTEVLLEEYHMPLRCPEGAHPRQWTAIQL